MSYKTILVHCDASRSVAAAWPSRPRSPSSSNRGWSGCTRASRSRSCPMSMAAWPSPLDGSLRGGLRRGREDRRAAYDKAIKGRNFASEWRVTEAFSDDALSVNARYADLLVVGQADPEERGSRNDLPEAMAFATGRPVLVVPHIGARRRRQDSDAVLERQPRKRARRGRCAAVPARGGKGHRAGGRSRDLGRRPRRRNPAPTSPCGSRAMASTSRCSATSRRMPRSARSSCRAPPTAVPT